MPQLHDGEGMAGGVSAGVTGACTEACYIFTNYGEEGVGGSTEEGTKWEGRLTQVRTRTRLSITHNSQACTERSSLTARPHLLRMP